ncbi:MAG: serine hydrolase domain-containing protein [Alphaproteobacteria bacterium]
MDISAKPQSVGLDSGQLDKLGRSLRAYVDDGRLSGVLSLVHRRGETVWRDIYGQADRERGRAMAEDTVFRIYSMTKPIVSVALMMLFEEGKVLLDDPVERWLPELADRRVLIGGETGEASESARRSITVRDLLAHTSGLTYGYFDDSAVGALYRKAEPLPQNGSGTLADMMTRLSGLPLACHPGEKWIYSLSTDVVGRLVEVLSGSDLRTFLKERILTPLGMAETDFWADGRADRLAANYTPDRDKGLRLLDDPAESRFARPVTFFSGGGGLTSTAGDYLRFCRMLAGGGSLEGVRILGPRTIDLMTSNHLPGVIADMSTGGFADAYTGTGFGLGFAVVLDPAAQQVSTSIGEYSWGGAATTIFWVDPQEDLIAMFFTQLMPNSSYPIRDQMRAIIYSAITD